MKRKFVHSIGWLYRAIGTKIFFLFDSEPIHEAVVHGGKLLGNIPGVPALMRALFRVRDDSLAVEVAGIRFENPVGMAAGFDHEARLTQIVGGLGLGFQSVGTVTNGSYAGNPYPRMKRLVKSRSLLVNKGFKSSGIDAVLASLEGKAFDIPIGISIGRTNTDAHEGYADAIADITASFAQVMRSRVPFAYFELNISCPNLTKDISFYKPEPLKRLLEAIFEKGIDRPLFIKMPIALSDADTLALLDVIRAFPVAAIIIGNLQHDTTVPAFDSQELEAHRHLRGKWSGMPCQSRSDALIRLCYRHLDRRIAIVGCGGIFCAEDAYRKIRLGARAVQMATGFVFSGPLLAAEIASDLPRLLARDGCASVVEAIGADA